MIGAGKNLSTSTDSDFFNSKPFEIDRDNFDNVLGKFNIKLELALKNSDESFVTIEIKEFDDFHPDNIFEQLPCFSYLRNIRRKLLNSETYNQAANEVRSWLDSSVEEKLENIDLNNSVVISEKSSFRRKFA